MVDERNDPALRAACAKSLMPFMHEDRSLAFKVQAENAPGTIMVAIRSFANPALPAPQGKQGMREPLPDAPGTPDPGARPAGINASNAPGVQRFTVERDADNFERVVPDPAPQHTGYFETRRGDDGIERLVEVAEPPRTYRPAVSCHHHHQPAGRGSAQIRWRALPRRWPARWLLGDQ